MVNNPEWLVDGEQVRPKAAPAKGVVCLSVCGLVCSPLVPLSGPMSASAARATGESPDCVDKAGLMLWLACERTIGYLKFEHTYPVRLRGFQRGA